MPMLDHTLVPGLSPQPQEQHQKDFTNSVAVLWCLSLFSFLIMKLRGKGEVQPRENERDTCNTDSSLMRLPFERWGPGA